MPLSRRDKKVSLTKTLKKGMKLKQHIVEDIRKSLDDFSNLFVFNIYNMRHGPMNELREEWKGSRFFLAKRKVMAIALGRTEESEVQKNLHKVAAHVVGECGLLFTNKPKDEVMRWFENYSKMDFAKSGFVAKETVTLAAGPLTDFSFSMEPRLRTLGLPTQLEKGIIVLREDYVVCRAGSHLSPEQAQLLKLIGKPMAEFKITLLCMWTKDDGSFEKMNIPHELKKKTPSKLLEKSHTKINSSKKKNGSIKDVGTAPLINPSELYAKLEETTKQGSDSGVTKKSPNQMKKSTGLSNTSFVEEIADKNVTDFVEELSSKTIKLENSLPSKRDILTLKQSPKKTIEMAKNKVNPGIISKQTSLIEKFKLEEVSDEQSDVEPMQVGSSSKPNVGTPRRSLRTPKPIKRTPEQKKMSIKKLTESSKTVTLKQTKPTPKRQSMRKPRSQMESEDVEMTAL